ncbi:MAG: hypothetical protein ACKVHU_16960 [Acidimicrobiales bacterium]|jgi:hypothetical protein
MATRTDSDTYRWVEDYREYRRLTPLDEQQVSDVVDVIGDVGREPAGYVADAFSQHDIIFLGHRTPSLQTGHFLQELIPVLHSKGVWAIGIEYACVDDQELLDALVRGPVFDEALARGALFRWGMRHHFAYCEYLDVLRAAWAVNQRRDPNAPAFRIVALDYDLDTDAVTETADLRSPYPWMHLRHRGSAGRHMANVIMREFIEPGHRALILCRTQHALTRLRRSPHATIDAFDFDLHDGKVVGAANHVYAAIADRAATILIHEALPADGYHGEFAFPGDGMLDAAFARNDGPKYPVAFDLNGNSLGQLQCSTAVDGGDLASWAHGWVFLESLDRVLAPTPLPNIVDDTNLADARRWALDGHLRRADVTAIDFNAAVSTSAAWTELIWAHLA